MVVGLGGGQGVVGGQGVEAGPMGGATGAP